MNSFKLYHFIVNKKINSIQQLLNHNLASASTIRRYLKKLEVIGVIELNYGGKIKVIDGKELSLKDEYKTDVNKSQKTRLGKLCANLVKEGDVLFIDNGTTVRNILKHLKDMDVIVYTNGYNHIQEANKYNINLKLIPGNILYKEAALIGEEALMYLSDLYFDKVFIGANGFDEKYGVTTPNLEEANLKKMLLTLSDNIYFVMDTNKYKAVTKHKICSFSKYPIITIDYHR